VGRRRRKTSSTAAIAAPRYEGQRAAAS
jgi:hypothetical protein